MKFIHLSDLHFHMDPNDNQQACALLQSLASRYPTHYLIVTGDITDDGHPDQYLQAQMALRPFLGRVFIAPGNHDFGAKGNLYSLERARRFDEMLSIPLHQGGTFSGDNTPVVNMVEDGLDQAMLIALDTNLETYTPFDYACGEVGREQLDCLNTILSSPVNHGMKKILFFHHHPFIHHDPIMELKDARELMRVIYNRVDVVLFGHKHVSNKWENVNGIRFFLASDNSPGKDWAREIVIENNAITVNDININIAAAATPAGIQPGPASKKNSKRSKAHA